MYDDNKGRMDWKIRENKRMNEEDGNTDNIFLLY